MKRALSPAPSDDSDGTQVGDDADVADTSTLQVPMHIQRTRSILKAAAANQRAKLQTEQVRIDDDAGLASVPAATLAHRMQMLCSCTPPKMHLMGTRCKDCGEYAFTPCESANAAYAAAAAAALGPLPPPHVSGKGEKPQIDDEVFAENDTLLDAPVETAARANESEEARKKRAGSAANYTKILVNGTEGNTGIMRARNKAGQTLEPMEHQRRTVKAFSKRSTTFFGLFDDPGLGKTATALQCIAAEKLMLGRVPRVLISVPVAVMRQWEDAIADWLRISPDRVLVTNQLKKITSEALESHDVVVVTKDLVSKAYRTCFSKQEQHHTIQTGWGQRWVSDWDRIPNTPLHALYGVESTDTREVERCKAVVTRLREQLADLRRQHRVAVNVAGSNMVDADVLSLECDIEKLEEEIDAANAAMHKARSESARTVSRKFDIVICDEAHVLRNPDATWTRAQAEISRHAVKVLALTATPVVNKLLDLAGLSLACNAPIDPINFQNKNSWCRDRAGKIVNKQTVAAFQKLTSRTRESVLNLPPLEQEAISYDVQVPPERAGDYNAALESARSLRIQLENQANGPTAAELQKLMAILGTLQQFTISPLLAGMGAACFKKNPELYERAAHEEEMGCMHALQKCLRELKNEGHGQIVIAAAHTSELRIASAFLRRNAPELGKHIVYTGELSQTQRFKAKETFLNTDKCLLFLSIEAGGTGLHLVPGPEAMVLFGSSPFAPAKVVQCMKRIHRIGQYAPIKGRVQIKHLVPYGSVDASIRRVHGDKTRLMNMVVDGEGMEDTTEAQWKRTGRIVDGALTLLPNGNFASMPQHMPTSDDSGTNGVAPNTPYTVVPGVVTRGRDPPQQAVQPGTSAAHAQSGAAAHGAGTKRPPPPRPSAEQQRRKQMRTDRLPSDVRAWKAARMEERKRRLAPIASLTVNDTL